MRCPNCGELHYAGEFDGKVQLGDVMDYRYHTVPTSRNYERGMTKNFCLDTKSLVEEVNRKNGTRVEIYKLVRKGIVVYEKDVNREG
jgi:hypothetical protein